MSALVQNEIFRDVPHSGFARLRIQILRDQTGNDCLIEKWYLNFTYENNHDNLISTKNMKFDLLSLIRQFVADRRSNSWQLKPDLQYLCNRISMFSLDSGLWSDTWNPIRIFGIPVPSLVIFIYILDLIVDSIKYPDSWIPRPDFWYPVISWIWYISVSSLSKFPSSLHLNFCKCQLLQQ